jgi:multicomponent Na+:H+ antiporter subunit D
LDDRAETLWNAAVGASTRGARSILTVAQHYSGPRGVLGRTWPTGIMAFWTTIMLAAYLILSYL